MLTANRLWSRAEASTESLTAEMIHTRVEASMESSDSQNAANQSRSQHREFRQPKQCKPEWKQAWRVQTAKMLQTRAEVSMQRVRGSEAEQK